MKKNKKNDMKIIEELLESDNELPDTCYERPDTPTYLNNSRYSKIRFGWIFHKKIQLNVTDVPKEEPKAVESKVETKREIYMPRKLLYDIPRKGILKRKDIYCLQSVENRLRGNVLLWFANFLVFKDLQSTESSPRGCLVYENVCDFKKHKHNSKDTSLDVDNNKKNKYKVIVKRI